MPLTLIQSLSLRVVSRLDQALSQEPDPWARDDLKIAKRLVLHAARGDCVECSPHVLASYEVLGLHPEKVWPAIQARRDALGPLSDLPPKKPAQSVKLWGKTINGARAVNSRAGEAMVLRGPRLLPMATASIAALYPNPDAPSSAKKREYTYEQMIDAVRHSYVRAAIKRATLNALTARGPWPGEDGPASGIICVAFDGMALGDKGGDGICHRRTAQRRAKLACDLKYWRLLHKFNRWLNCPKCGTERTSATCPNAECKHRGRSRNRDGSTNVKEFCRPWTFEIDLEKFLTAPPPKHIRHFCARTWKEHKAAAKRGEHPNLVEMPSPKPAQPVPPPKGPAPAAPMPKQPAAEHEHRSTERTAGRHTYRQAKAFKDRIEYHVAGCSGSVRAGDGSTIFVSPDCNVELYRAPMNRALAFKRTLEEFGWTVDSAIEAMKFHGFTIGPKGERGP